MEQYLKIRCKCGQLITGVHVESSQGETTDHIYLGDHKKGEVLHENKFSVKGKRGLNDLSKEMASLMKVHERETHAE